MATSDTTERSETTALFYLSRLHLRATDGPHAGQTFPVDEHDTIIGREGGVQLVSPGVSRRHAGLRYTGGHFVVCDLGSRNGTYLNGELVKGQLPIEEGDVLELGEHRLVVHLIGSRAGATPLVSLDGAPALVSSSSLTQPPPPAKRVRAAPVAAVTAPPRAKRRASAAVVVLVLALAAGSATAQRYAALALPAPRHTAPFAYRVPEVSGAPTDLPGPALPIVALVPPVAPVALDAAPIATEPAPARRRHHHRHHHARGEAATRGEDSATTALRQKVRLASLRVKVLSGFLPSSSARSQRH